MVMERTLGEASDTDLLEQLRSGDTEAYTELWRRHVRAALRHAHRVTPQHAEDLVSESFLAIYRQITMRNSGPRDAFRAYLFTVIRNTAHTWHRQGKLVDTDPDVDEIEVTDGLRSVEDRAISAELLTAFQNLPERWQRVLWLTEVEEAGRPAIAAELGIKPNAVSALYRRARQGLRKQWLIQQVPADLREDSTHVAHLLPEFTLAPKGRSFSREMRQHMRSCDRCAALYVELRDASTHMQTGVLATAGFAALGVSLPAAAPLTATTTVAALTWFSGMGTTIAASIGILLAGGTLTTSLLIGVADSARVSGAAPAGEGVQHTASDDDPTQGGTPEHQAADESGTDQLVTGAPSSQTVLGRGNTDASLTAVEFFDASEFAPPARGDAPRPIGPSPLPPNVSLEPAPGDQLGDGSGTVGATPPVITSDYFAPTLSGVTSPGSAVTIALDGYDYAPTIAEDGSWSMDLRDLDLPVGEYPYRVQTEVDGESSVTEAGVFTIIPVQVSGLNWSEDFFEAEAASSGVVVQFIGPPNATLVVIDAPSSQMAFVELDENGEAIRRMRFFGSGAHFLNFAVYADGYAGGIVQIGVVIMPEDDGSPAPWRPEGDGFELSELSEISEVTELSEPSGISGLSELE